MNKKVLHKMLFGEGIYDCICDPYDAKENGDYYSSVEGDLERLIEKVVEECRDVIAQVYRNTPLEHCGIVLDVDDAILEYFYGQEDNDLNLGVKLEI